VTTKIYKDIKATLAISFKMIAFQTLTFTSHQSVAFFLSFLVIKWYWLLRRYILFPPGDGVLLAQGNAARQYVPPSLSHF